MGKWCLHASSFIFDRIIIKVAGNQDGYKSSDEFDFGPLVSMAHLYVFLNEIWPCHIGLRWAIVALWATCYDKYAHLRSCIESLSRPHCAFIINTHTTALCGILVTAAPRICDKNAHVRSHAESWSRPQMRIHDSRFHVESLSRPQLRFYDYFVDFFLCWCLG